MMSTGDVASTLVRHHALSPLGLAALSLATETGAPVFPCLPRTKNPAVGGLKADGTRWDRKTDPLSARVVAGAFHRATTHAEQVAQWWQQQPEANIGVRLGAALRLTCIEADTDEANRALLAMAEDWPPTWTYAASRGTNWLFAAPADIPERPVRHLWPEDFGAGIECKTGLGFIVAPPSVHPSGHVYQWMPARAPDECTLAPLPHALADEVRRVDAARELAHRDRRGALPFLPTPAADAFDAVRTLDALRYLDAHDYSTWRDVGLALKGTGHPAARGIWDAWSASSDKFDPAEQDRQWTAFTPTTITVASIFFHASRAGWHARRAA